MLNFKEKLTKGLLWLEDHSRKLRETLAQEKKCNAIARAGLRRIMSAYNNDEEQKTNLEDNMYQIAKETYEKLTEDNVKEEDSK